MSEEQNLLLSVDGGSEMDLGALPIRIDLESLSRLIGETKALERPDQFESMDSFFMRTLKFIVLEERTDGKSDRACLLRAPDTTGLRVHFGLNIDAEEHYHAQLADRSRDPAKGDGQSVGGGYVRFIHVAGDSPNHFHVLAHDASGGLSGVPLILQERITDALVTSLASQYPSQTFQAARVRLDPGYVQPECDPRTNPLFLCFRSVRQALERILGSVPAKDTMGVKKLLRQMQERWIDWKQAIDRDPDAKIKCSCAEAYSYRLFLKETGNIHLADQRLAAYVAAHPCPEEKRRDTSGAGDEEDMEDDKEDDGPGYQEDWLDVVDLADDEDENPCPF